MDFSMHRDREHDRLEPGALAGGAGHLAHVALEALPAGVALGLAVPPLDERDRALEGAWCTRARGRTGCGSGPRSGSCGRAAAPSWRAAAARPRGCRYGSPARRRARRSGGRSSPWCGRATRGGWRPRRGDLSSSGTISSGSTSMRVPMPVQSGQAPKGELKEKERGSSSSKDRSSYGQYRCSENIRSRSGSSSGEVDEVEHDHAAGEAERGLHRVGEPALGAVLHREAVDDHLDGVLLLLLQRGRARRAGSVSPSTRARL